MILIIENQQAKVRCNQCLKDRIIHIKNANKSKDHICRSCSCKNKPRPQNQKKYWTKEQREKISNGVKTSKRYYTGISQRNQSGPRNGMYGKKHNADTKAKMSASRIGKIGPLATAWKGGKRSICKRVKSILQTRYKWFSKVFEKYNKKCVRCGQSSGKLDAHHIKPINQIIKELCYSQYFVSDEEKIEWLLSQEKIVDKDLENGIVLCRNCHKATHTNWGSHATI